MKGKFPNTKSLSHFKWKKRGGAIRNAERFYIIFYCCSSRKERDCPIKICPWSDKFIFYRFISLKNGEKKVKLEVIIPGRIYQNFSCTAFLSENGGD